MGSRPRLLDLFCGAGGAAMGYHRAGFDVVGVDVKPQPRYPFDFIPADVLTLRTSDPGVGRCAVYGPPLGAGPAWPDKWIGSFHAIHASPPCQAHTAMSNRWRGSGGRADSHADLIGWTRDFLIASGLPYVIENVPGARRAMRETITLTGGMFGLRVHRPRLFESNVLLLAPEPARAPRDSVGVFGKRHDGRLLWRRRDGTEQRAAKSLEEARDAMGMPWASWRGCAEAVPPAYTEWIGRQLLAAVEARRTA